MNTITKKSVTENTLARAATLVKKCKLEDRAATDDEFKERESLISAYNLATGRNVQNTEHSITSFCEQVPDHPGIIVHPMGDARHGAIRPLATVEDRANRIQFIDAKTGDRVSSLTRDEKVSNLSSGPQCANNDPFAVGNYIKAIATGDDNALQEFSAIKGDDTRGGYMTPTQISGNIVDLARAASVVDKAGAQTIPMSTGELGLIRVSQDPTAQWRAEGQDILASEPGYELVKLQAKTVAAAITISVELLEDAANAPQVIQHQLQAALGLALDKAALDGTGSENEPRGIVNSENVNEVASVGTPSNNRSISSAIGKIVQANYTGDMDKLAYILHPRDEEIYDSLTDSTGQPLRQTPWASKLQRLYTTSIPTTLGSGSDESYGIIGDFSQMLIGMRTQGVRIAVLDSGSIVKSWTPDGSASAIQETINAASSLQRIIVAYMRADVALLRPTWFTKLTGVTIS